MQASNLKCWMDQNWNEQRCGSIYLNLASQDCEFSTVCVYKAVHEGNPEVAASEEPVSFICAS